MLQQDENRLLPQVKQEKADRDNCNLDLKVEVNISSECSLPPGECLHNLFAAVLLLILSVHIVGDWEIVGHHDVGSCSAYGYDHPHMKVT